MNSFARAYASCQTRLRRRSWRSAPTGYTSLILTLAALLSSSPDPRTQAVAAGSLGLQHDDSDLILIQVETGGHEYYVPVLRCEVSGEQAPQQAAQSFKVGSVPTHPHWNALQGVFSGQERTPTMPHRTFVETFPGYRVAVDPKSALPQVVNEDSVAQTQLQELLDAHGGSKSNWLLSRGNSLAARFVVWPASKSNEKCLAFNDLQFVEALCGKIGSQVLVVQGDPPAAATQILVGTRMKDLLTSRERPAWFFSARRPNEIVVAYEKPALEGLPETAYLAIDLGRFGTDDPFYKSQYAEAAFGAPSIRREVPLPILERLCRIALDARKPRLLQDSFTASLRQSPNQTGEICNYALPASNAALQLYRGQGVVEEVSVERKLEPSWLTAEFRKFGTFRSPDQSPPMVIGNRRYPASLRSADNAETGRVELHLGLVLTELRLTGAGDSGQVVFVQRAEVSVSDWQKFLRHELTLLLDRHKLEQTVWNGLDSSFRDSHRAIELFTALGKGTLASRLVVGASQRDLLETYALFVQIRRLLSESAPAEDSSETSEEAFERLIQVVTSRKDIMGRRAARIADRLKLDPLLPMTMVARSDIARFCSWLGGGARVLSHEVRMALASSSAERRDVVVGSLSADESRLDSITCRGGVVLGIHRNAAEWTAPLAGDLAEDAAWRFHGQPFFDPDIWGDSQFDGKPPTEGKVPLAHRWIGFRVMLMPEP